ncbi:putative membrane protein YeaQ/YmgE (transglycosylase-associated protein family) [Rahnella sp. BIGb0236]|uniref:GlsB/YeaQ/YmgE family stress response membrane protein n=1 Tax=Rahnella sp. BIGb0236 TaxID=2485117 RepID=UPI00105B277F|nr:GlsB/YeaQ/YmgE family stress response membrane protein [Rahnella sp. BIGb0236]TDS84861.1 putative membrane protein YeaQ/YmgE (transglycosylase-associated protein family) [Rahnella sp. BIGb0236]
MGILSWVLFGLVTGVLARCVMPGKQHIGLFMTILLGVAGALTGGWVSTSLGLGNVNGFNFPSVAIATLGAVILLFFMHMLRSKKQH